MDNPVTVSVSADTDEFTEDVDDAIEDINRLREALEEADAALQRLNDRDDIDLTVSVTYDQDTVSDPRSVTERLGDKIRSYNFD